MGFWSSVSSTQRGLAGVKKVSALLHGWFPHREEGWGACLSPGDLSQHLRWPPLVLEDEPRVQMEHLGVSTHLVEPQGVSLTLLGPPADVAQQSTKIQSSELQNGKIHVSFMWAFIRKCL